MAMAEETIDSISQEENQQKILLWQEEQCQNKFIWQEKEIGQTQVQQIDPNNEYENNERDSDEDKENFGLLGSSSPKHQSRKIAKQTKKVATVKIGNFSKLFEKRTLGSFKLGWDSEEEHTDVAPDCQTSPWPMSRRKLEYNNGHIEDTLCQGLQLAKVYEEQLPSDGYDQRVVSNFGNYPDTEPLISSLENCLPYVARQGMSGSCQAGTFWDQPITSRMMSKEKSLLQDLDKAALVHSKKEKPIFDTTWAHIENPPTFLPSLINAGYQPLEASPTKTLENGGTINWNTNPGPSLVEPDWNGGFTRLQNHASGLLRAQQNKTNCNQDDFVVKVPLTIQHLRRADIIRMKDSLAVKQQRLNAWLDSQAAELNLVSLCKSKF